MKIIIQIIIIFISLHTLWSAPVAEINKFFIDFKNVKQGIVLKDNSIILKNSGDEGLELKLQSTCECLKVSADEKFLEPGKQININIAFNTEKYEGETKKYFYLVTNDPTHRMNRLYVKVNIIIEEKKQEDIISIISEEGKSKYDNKLKFYFFNAPDCHECIKIKNNIFPDLEKKYKVKLEWIDMNTLMQDNMEKLLKVKSHLKIDNDRFPVILFHDLYISGFKNIYKEFPELIKKYHDKKIKVLDIDKLDEKQIGTSLSLLPVLFAGLIDGINPCAFATIIFLLSYLNYIKKSRKTILITGIFYTSSVFITYLLIGLGFLKGITAFPLFHKVSLFIHLVIALFTFFLAYLSLKDYFLARKGKFNEMVLQLPDSFKKRIHKNIRERTRGKMIIFSAIILGFFVSLIELACTGQIYLPTIIYLTKMKSIAGYVYLILYNVMFILPLIFIFYAYLIGVSSEKIAEVFKKNIALIKLLTFILFISLGVLLILTRVL